MKLRFSPVLILAVLAACAPPSAPETASTAEPQVPVVAPQPTKPAVVQPTGSWLDWPISQGDWIYRQDARGSIALFGGAGADALVTLRCDRGRGRIFLSRRSDLASSAFTLRSSARLKNANAATTGGTPSYLAIELLPTDPILDALAYSRGRIALQATGEQSIALPVWSEIGRIVEDCRR